MQSVRVELGSRMKPIEIRMILSLILIPFLFSSFIQGISLHGGYLRYQNYEFSDKNDIILNVTVSCECKCL